MKRFLCLILVLCCVAAFPLTASAASPEENTEIIYNADGSYIVVTWEDVPARAAGSITKSKTYEYYSATDELMWKAVLRGVFHYDGTSATCTSSVCDVYVYTSNWYLISKNPTASGNTASATVVMGKKVLGITVAEEEYLITISCDKDGNTY